MLCSHVFFNAALTEPAHWPGGAREVLRDTAEAVVHGGAVLQAHTVVCWLSLASRL